MEAKALSFVLHTWDNEFHQKATTRVFTYVVGGHVVMKNIVILGAG